MPLGLGGKPEFPEGKARGEGKRRGDTRSNASGEGRGGEGRGGEGQGPKAKAKLEGDRNWGSVLAPYPSAAPCARMDVNIASPSLPSPGCVVPSRSPAFPPPLTARPIISVFPSFTSVSIPHTRLHGHASR